MHRNKSCFPNFVVVLLTLCRKYNEKFNSFNKYSFISTIYQVKSLGHSIRNSLFTLSQTKFLLKTFSLESELSSKLKILQVRTNSSFQNPNAQIFANSDKGFIHNFIYILVTQLFLLSKQESKKEYFPGLFSPRTTNKKKATLENKSLVNAQQGNANENDSEI